jgi:hypothetical protein
MRITLCSLTLMLGLTSACAAGRLPNARGLDVIVKPASAALTADAAGVRAIQAATRCDADFVRVLSSGAMLVRLWPTDASPDVNRCLQQIKSMPGVQYAEPDAVMKTS